MLVSGRVNICVAEDWNVPGVPVSRKTMCVSWRYIGKAEWWHFGCDMRYVYIYIC